MIVVGITGGIGAGKSIVSKIIQTLGYPIYNSDDRAKAILTTDTDVHKEITEKINSEVISNGKIDRNKLASIVFNDEEKLKALNKIIHPKVALDFQGWTKEQSSNLVFKEAAILFESGAYKYVDKSIVVTAPKETRIKRVMARDNVTQKQVESRMKNQWSEEKKIKLADFIVDNSGNRLVTPRVLNVIQIVNNLLIKT